MHGWEKRDAVLICQGASRVQVRRGAAGPREKEMKRVHVRIRENEKEEEGRNEAGNYMIVMHDLGFKGGLRIMFY